MDERVDAVELLTSQHREVERLWAEAQASRSSEAAERVIRLLSQHDAIETQYLYPALRGVDEAGDRLADRSLEDHQRIRELLKEADRDLGSPASWDSLAAAVAEVERHVQEEEAVMFPKLRTVGDDDLAELGSAMVSTMSMAPTHPHPTQPNNPVGAAVMGGVAGVVDRIRDAMKKAS